MRPADLIYETVNTSSIYSNCFLLLLWLNKIVVIHKWHAMLFSRELLEGVALWFSLHPMIVLHELSVTLESTDTVFSDQSKTPWSSSSCYKCDRKERLRFGEWENNCRNIHSQQIGPASPIAPIWIIASLQVWFRFHGLQFDNSFQATFPLSAATDPRDWWIRLIFILISSLTVLHLLRFIVISAFLLRCCLLESYSGSS